MSSNKLSNIRASVSQRLKNIAKVTKDDFTLIQTNYAIERLLARLEHSKHADQFVLKGGTDIQATDDGPAPTNA